MVGGDFLNFFFLGIFGNGVYRLRLKKILAYKSSLRDSISKWTPRGKYTISDVIRTLKSGLPQANGQTEVMNRSLLKIIKTWLEGEKSAWPEELPNVLWAYRLTTKVPMRETPFRLTFGTEAVILVGIRRAEEPPRTQ